MSALWCHRAMKNVELTIVSRPRCSVNSSEASLEGCNVRMMKQVCDASLKKQQYTIKITLNKTGIPSNAFLPYTN